MAVMASKGNNVTQMCSYFNSILQCSKEYIGGMWSYYVAHYRKKAGATHNSDWSAIDTNLYSKCFTGRAKKTLACADCGSLKHITGDCPRKPGKQAASDDTRAPPAKKERQKPAVCYNWNYNRPCHSTPCTYKHECIKCSPEEHTFVECPKRGKKTTK